MDTEMKKVITFFLLMLAELVLIAAMWLCYYEGRFITLVLIAIATFALGKVISGIHFKEAESN